MDKRRKRRQRYTGRSRFPVANQRKNDETRSNFEEGGGRGRMQTRTGFLHWENASVFEILSDEFCSFLALDAAVSAGAWAAKGNGIK